MRLFFAFALDESVRAACAAFANELHARLRRVHSGGAVKWVERENLHVTLRFLGEVDDGRAARLLEALGEPLNEPAFQMRVGGAGAFPPSGAPRVLWAGAREGADAARAVFDALDRRLAPLAFDREERAYTPHLTLGRVREISGRTGRQLREWLAAAPQDFGTVAIDRVSLYRSDLSPAGPRYRVIHVLPLAPVTT